MLSVTLLRFRSCSLPSSQFTQFTLFLPFSLYFCFNFRYQSFPSSFLIRDLSVLTLILYFCFLFGTSPSRRLIPPNVLPFFGSFSTYAFTSITNILPSPHCATFLYCCLSLLQFYFCFPFTICLFLLHLLPQMIIRSLCSLLLSLLPYQRLPSSPSTLTSSLLSLIIFVYFRILYFRILYSYIIFVYFRFSSTSPSGSLHITFLTPPFPQSTLVCLFLYLSPHSLISALIYSYFS